MQPTQGRIVIVSGTSVRSNGCDTAPAIVTRAWGQREDGAWVINATVLPDAGTPKALTSVALYAGAAEVEAARDALPEHTRESVTLAYWPSRG